MKFTIEISPGDFFDKISILEIKQERIQDELKLKNVQLELNILNKARNHQIQTSSELKNLCSQLKSINETLWEIEDDIRDCESKNDFGDNFISLARNVYKNNDKRSKVKRHINVLLGALLMEEKSYAPY